MSRNGETGVLPYPLAMVICDAIWTDPGSGKHTLLGTFSEIHARSFPAVHNNLGVYIEVTGVHGAIPIKVRCVDAEEEHGEKFRIDGTAEVGNPIDVLRLAFNAPQITFDQPGEYRIQFFANNEFLIERKILLKQVPSG